MALGNISKEEKLKNEAIAKIREAEKAIYEYARYLEIGKERTDAFEIYDNIRNAMRVH